RLLGTCGARPDQPAFGPVSPGPLLGGQGVPKANGVIARTGSQPCAIGAEGNGMHIVRMPMELHDLVVSGQVPQADGVILAGSDQPGAVGTEGQAVNDAAVREKSNLCLGFRVPEPDGVVQAGRGDLLAIRAVADAGAFRLVSAQHAAGRAGGDIPQSYRPISLRGC